MNRFLLSLVLSSFFLYGTVFSQQREILKLAQSQLEEGQNVSDSIINDLIKIANDTLSSDSLKVEIVYLFGALCCDTCLAYLIEHVNDRFSYGNGVSEKDQYNATACYSVLVDISYENNRRWKLLQPIFNSLQQNERKEIFIIEINRFMYYIFGKSIAKAIFQYELEENRRKPGKNIIYEKNLLTLLKQYD